METDARIEVVKSLDVEAFKKFMVEEGQGDMSDFTALASLHKARSELGLQEVVPRELGAESGRWLAERGMWHGVRWWLL